MSKTLELRFPKKVTRNGQETTVWSTHGIIFTKDDGKQSVRLDSVPVGITGDIWFHAMEPKPRN